MSYTGDRTEFLGRNGSPQDPAGLRNERLSGRLGPALDPCTAIQVPVELDADQQLDVVFRLGVGANHDDAYDVAGRSRGTATRSVPSSVRNHWRRTLDTVHVETPEPAIDAMANGWLLYRTIACRYLARSGYYQSGGAFGFRDQLQDTMAMLDAEPDLAREHLLLCASRQFLDGDVQHGGIPHRSGSRTRCSDDYLWLAVAAARYVDVTGDHTVLDETVNYLGRTTAQRRRRVLLRSPRPRRRRRNAVPALRAGAATRHATSRGTGLAADGKRDWNDGMNRVGRPDGVKASGSDSSSTTPSSASKPSPDAAPTIVAEDAATATQLQVNLDLHAGTAAGIGRPGSTTARCSAQRATQHARSSSIAQAGPCSPAPPTRNGPPLRWPPSTGTWCAATPA